ncbi:MAG: hypothetical protein OXF83_09170 [Anaerolineaceae bacterium]|nr:hypothetical protein [Anaerolineaceae bacterium]
MNWQDPKTWNTGDLLTAQDMNAQLRDNLRYLKDLPYMQQTIRRNSNYTTSSRSFVDIDGSNLSLTLRLAGAVMVGFLGTFQMDRSAQVCLDLLVDGVRLGNERGISCLHFSNSNVTQSFTFTFLRDQLAAGEHTFRLQWRVSSGRATLFAAAGTNDPPIFFWLRALP